MPSLDWQPSIGVSTCKATRIRASILYILTLVNLVRVSYCLLKTDLTSTWPYGIMTLTCESFHMASVQGDLQSVSHPSV